MNCAGREHFLNLMQKRVANISIGAATLRNQGAKGVIECARQFLAGLKLIELKDINAQQFKQWLNEKTYELMNKFPDGATNNWGAARKAVNIFLLESCLNRFLAAEYSLDRLVEYMETPMDNIAARKIIKES